MSVKDELCDDRPVGRTVLIVDDHKPFRRAARELLTAEGKSPALGFIFKGELTGAALASLLG